MAGQVRIAVKALRAGPAGVDSRAMPDRATSPSAPREGIASEDRDALLEEIARQKEEILRLRDLLIAKDAELGVAKGGLAELAEHSARFAVAVRAVQARLRVPGLLRKVALRLRRQG